MSKVDSMLSCFMRKFFVCLFCVSTPCVVLTTNGQESFIPMLKDGRVWNCMEVYLDEEKNDTLICAYRIEGTSEIDGHICYNLCLGSKQVGRYYEEGPKVFHSTTNGWELAFDFSLSLGDAIPNFGDCVVDEVKTTVMKGVSRRCLYFPLTTDDGTRLCWIEGIGSSLYGPYNYNVVIGSLLSVKLLSVYDGDICIFEANEGNAPTGIDIIKNEQLILNAERPIYNLQGFRINSQLKKGIYIQNGKKVAVK